MAGDEMKLQARPRTYQKKEVFQREGLPLFQGSKVRKQRERRGGEER